MATISGKRFQITDGAASPTNLFPYTVTEAVYGLSTVLANTQSAAVSAAATSAAGLYVPLTRTVNSKALSSNITLTLDDVADGSTRKLANYLPLTGGKISSSTDSLPFIINSSYGTETNFNIQRSGQHKAQIGYWDSRGLTLYEYTTGGYIYISNTNGKLYKDGGYEFYHSGNSNKSDVAWTCSGLTIGAPGSHGLIGCQYHTTDTNKYNYIDFYGSSNDGDIRYVAGTWTGSNHISHRFIVGINGSIDALTITNNGNVGIGTSSPTQKLHVEGGVYASSGYRTTNDFGLYKGSDITNGLTANDGALYYSGHFLAVWAYSFKVYANIDVTGNILSTGDQVISSDLTLKTNLKDVTYSVSDIAKCRAVTFDWKDGHGHSAGSIAQDWKPLIPELVHGKEGSMTLAYGQIALVNTIIEAREIEVLKKRVAELEAEVKRLRS